VYDGMYVALAELLECTLVTLDTRLARAPGPRCSIIAYEEAPLTSHEQLTIISKSLLDQRRRSPYDWNRCSCMVEMDSRTDCSPLEVADAICQLGSAINATHRELLAWVALSDRRGDWREDGAHDMAQWLGARLGVRHSTACEWVRVAHALESLHRPCGPRSDPSCLGRSAVRGTARS
jgi:hypothetical protein